MTRCSLVFVLRSGKSIVLPTMLLGGGGASEPERRREREGETDRHRDRVWVG